MILFAIYTVLTSSIIQTDPITQELTLFSKSLDNLAWKTSPITLLKSWSIDDIAPEINLKTVVPSIKSPNEKFFRADTTVKNLLHTTVSQQTGTLCGFHALKNTIFLLSALLSETSTEAKKFLRWMVLENTYKFFQNRINETGCATTNREIEDFLIAIKQNKLNYHLIMHNNLFKMLSTDSDLINVLSLNRTFVNDGKPFESVATKQRLVYDAETFKVGSAPQSYPMIILASTSAQSNQFNAHFVSLITIRDGIDTVAFLCDSLSNSLSINNFGYGLSEYIPMLLEQFFDKS